MCFPRDFKAPYINFCLGLVLFMLILPVSAQSIKDSLSLNNVLMMVIDKNPVLKQKEGNIGISNSKIGIAKSNKYPKVLFEGSFTYVDPVSEVNLPIGESPIILPLFPNDNWNLYAGVQYNLYDFGRTKDVVSISEIQKLISEEGLEGAQKKMTYAAANIYHSILFTEKAITVQDKLISSLKRNLNRVDGLIENGLATNFDRVNTNVRIKTAENKKVTLHNSLTHLKHKLAVVMGINPTSNTDLINVKGSLNVSKPYLYNLDTIKGVRNDLNIVRHLDSIQSRSQKLIGKANLPIVTVGGTTGFHNGYMPNLDDFRFNYAVFTKVTVPIFQGFKVKHEQEIAKLKLKNSKWHIEDVEIKINTELELAKASLEDAYEQYENNKILIQQAQISVQQARKKYANQLITNLDLLDTEVLLAGAELSLLESVYRCVIAKYKFQEAIGIKIWE